MKSEAVEQQAKMYMFDLNNCAKEHWFKADEGWEFRLATDAGKLALEKKFKPTISTRALPEILLQLMGRVKEGPVQIAPINPKIPPYVQPAQEGPMQHLIAFNPNRVR